MTTETKILVEDLESFRVAVEELADVKKQIKDIEGLFKEAKAEAKKTRESYALAIEIPNKQKTEIEVEMQEWVLATWQKEKEQEERTGIPVPSAVDNIKNFSATPRKVLGGIDKDKIPAEYWTVDLAKIKADCKNDESLEIEGVTWETVCTFTNTTKKENRG
jgi:hypothetical protein